MIEKGKTVSSKYIFQRLLANHTVNDSTWINDGIDWIGQAMRFIGKHAGFPVTIACDLYVQDYNTPFPCNMEGLIAITYKGLLLPLGSDLSGIGFERKIKKEQIDKIANDDVIVELNTLIQQKNELIEQYAITPTNEIALKINEVAGKIAVRETYINTLNQYQYSRIRPHGEFFNIKKDCIQTSFSTGYIDVVYTSFPLDEEGYPLIIDNEFYIQAIEWYMILMLIQKGYAHPIFDYTTAYSMFWGGSKLEPVGWRAKAANNVRIPDLQDAERFTRMWEQFRFRRDLPIQLFNRTEQPFGLLY